MYTYMDVLSEINLIIIIIVDRQVLPPRYAEIELYWKLLHATTELDH